MNLNGTEASDATLYDLILSHETKYYPFDETPMEPIEQNSTGTN